MGKENRNGKLRFPALILAGKEKFVEKEKREVDLCLSGIHLLGERSHLLSCSTHDHVLVDLISRSVESNGELVEPRSDEGSHEGSDNRHPEPSLVREDIASVSHDESEETGSEVTGGIAGITTVETEGSTNGKEGKTHEEGHDPAGIGIALVCQMGNEETEDGCSQHLINESIEHGEMGTGVRGEDSRRSLGSCDCMHSTVELVDGIVVDGISESRTTEGTEELSDEVENESDRGELLEGQEHQRDSRVDVTAR